MEIVSFTQISEKESIRDFIFSILFLFFNVIICMAFCDNLGTFITYVLTVLIYAPIIYWIVMFAKRKKTNQYDFSVRGFISNGLLIISSIIGIPGYICACLFHDLFSPIIFVGIPMIVGIGVMIAFIVLAVRDYKNKMNFLNSKHESFSENISAVAIKENTIDFLSVVLAIFACCFIFFTFYETGEGYRHGTLDYMYSFYGQIIGILALISLVIRLIKAIALKKFAFTRINMFMAIGSFSAGIASFAITGGILLGRIDSYHFTEKTEMWTPIFVFVLCNILLIVVSIVYFGLYFHANKNQLSSEKTKLSN